MTAISEPIELTPDEYNQFVLICAKAQRKWLGGNATVLNLMSYKSYIEDRCLQELGIVVAVDVTNEEFIGDTTETCISPIVTPWSRAEPTPIDHEVMAYQIQHGFADGVVGVLKEDGTLAEPSKKIAMPGSS